MEINCEKPKSLLGEKYEKKKKKPNSNGMSNFHVKLKILVFTKNLVIRSEFICPDKFNVKFDLYSIYNIYNDEVFTIQRKIFTMKR